MSDNFLPALSQNLSSRVIKTTGNNNYFVFDSEKIIFQQNGSCYVIGEDVATSFQEMQ